MKARSLLCILLGASVFSPALAQDAAYKKSMALQQAQMQQLTAELGKLKSRVRMLEETAQWMEPYGFVVFNSVGREGGDTLSFWNIPYKDRLTSKGSCGGELESNCYLPGRYLMGPGVYTDVIEDVTGKVAVAMVAEASGLDTETMRFKEPRFISGVSVIYERQFAAGWSSPDKDLDPWDGNCASSYANVTQHYAGCWIYNLGADADGPYADNGWGPHLYGLQLRPLGLESGNDSSNYVRVKRITRFWKPK